MKPTRTIVRYMSNYRTDSNLIAKAFKALSNPNRLEIFRQLVACCPNGQTCDLEDSLCIGELGKSLSIAPSTLSHHIKELANAGLVETERQGKNILCRVELTKVNELASFFNLQRETHE